MAAFNISTSIYDFSNHKWCASGTFDPEEIDTDNKALALNLELVPIKIIFNPPATICIFPDGERVVVKCTEGDTFSKQAGVAMCIIKRMFGSRANFKRLVDSGYLQPPERETKK